MITVGSTLARYKVDGSELNWLTNAEEMLDSYPDLVFFLALEVRPGGDIADFGRLLDRLYELPHAVWTFSLDDEQAELTSFNRLTRICMGRNLVSEFGGRSESTHVLFLDCDLIVPGDALIKLLEVARPAVGGDVPAYCLSGPSLEGYPFPVQEHWNTAGFLLVERDAFTRVRWRHEHFVAREGLTDDPCYAADLEAIGFGKTAVRKDVVGRHVPLIPMEDRGHDRSLA